MEPTPESLFERHLASQSGGDIEDALAAEIEAFGALLEKYPNHAKELTRLRDAEKSESQGSSGPLVGDIRAAKGVTIGDFQLVKKLGRGGMGEVWEAEQLSLSRRIALKLLPSAGSERAQEFFGREARAGGRLNHPGIVSVMGTGEDEGVRWISMELVEGGRTLRDFLDEMRAKEELPDQYYPETAELFAKIAEAMAVAHEAGVVHRDLKPANIMLTGDGEPKVADFGLARVLDEQGLSQSGEVMGTFYYMSPEQVKAARGGVDHRADVFSLGALFYEALVMARPFEGDTTLQIVEKILNHDPPDPKVLRSRVPEDLAVICTKALEKEREGRYASMTEMAADLRRHLADEPIQAQPPSTWRRAVKWARRNPTKSVAGAVAAAAFVAISGLAWQLQEKTEEAEQRAANLQQVSDFQARQLSEVDAMAMGTTIRTKVIERARAAGEREGRKPEELDQERAALERFLAGTDFTGLALDVLDKHVFEEALQKMEGLENQPLVQAELLHVAAGALSDLGLLNRALKPQERALEIRRQMLGNEHLQTLDAIYALGGLFLDKGSVEEAEPLLREGLKGCRRTLGNEHLDTLYAACRLGSLLLTQGKAAEGAQLVREAVKTARLTRGNEDRDYLSMSATLASLLAHQGLPAEAEQIYVEVIETSRRTLGREDILTIRAAGDWAGILSHQQGRLDEAELLIRETQEVQRRVLGHDHPETLGTTFTLGDVFRRQGKLDEAERLYREGLAGYRRIQSQDGHNALLALTQLGDLCKAQGRLDEAEGLYREALAGYRRDRGDEDESTRAIEKRLMSLRAAKFRDVITGGSDGSDG